ncbi:hypothetical protein GCM10020000_31830 [Streptomyces olivoverticillatus]
MHTYVRNPSPRKPQRRAASGTGVLEPGGEGQQGLVDVAVQRPGARVVGARRVERSDRVRRADLDRLPVIPGGQPAAASPRREHRQTHRTRHTRTYPDPTHPRAPPAQ